MIRLFVAIATPPGILPSLTAARDCLKESRADVRWEPAEKLHCTLKFLGDTREDLVAPVLESLATIARAIPPFNVVFRDIGCFPDRHNPRIIWAGLQDPAGDLKKLFDDVDNAMSGLGFERERRAFHPHVTLGRVTGSRRIPELLETMETVTLNNPPVTIQEMELVKSTLRQSGSAYSLVAKAAFGAGEPGRRDR